MILGFEFETNTEPFAVYNMVNSFIVSMFVFISSEISNKAGFRAFFIGTGTFALISQFIIISMFKFKNEANKKNSLKYKKDSSEDEIA